MWDYQFGFEEATKTQTKAEHPAYWTGQAIKATNNEANQFVWLQMQREFIGNRLSDLKVLKIKT